MFIIESAAFDKSSNCLKSEKEIENELLEVDDYRSLSDVLTSVARFFGHAHLTVQIISEAPTRIFKKRIFTNLP